AGTRRSAPLAGGIRLAVLGEAQERDDGASRAHGPPHVCVVAPQATPTVCTHAGPQLGTFVSKQYCGCGKPCSMFTGHWQHFAPTTRWPNSHFPVPPLQTCPAGASVSCRVAHVACASVGSASKQAPVAWQQRVVTFVGTVVVVVEPA